MAKLSVVGTPIGNLEDITLRAIRVLREADVIFCEDTRVTGKLLKAHTIETPLKRCDAEKEMQCAEYAIELLLEGKSIAYVSDAGTPGISDPGSRLVHAVRERLPEVTIEAIPGPSALTAALSISGLKDGPFQFLGFLPHKKGRQTALSAIAEASITSVMYESPHRIMKTLEALKELAPTRIITVCRELTKVFEEVVRGTPEEVIAHFEEDSKRLQGEFVVIVE